MISQSKNSVTSPIAPFRLAVVPLLVLLLTGCGSDSPIPVSDYASRLERVLDTQLVEIERQPTPRLPRVRELTHSFSEEGIDLLEFLALVDCELHSLIAERNSSLGKLAQPSQQLVYELNFLRAGSVCVQQISNEDEELAAQLNNVLQTKQQELPARIWNALMAGEEFRRFWSATGDSLLVDTRTQLAIGSLQSDVVRWLSGDYAVDASALEENLAAVSLGGGGDVINTWLRLSEDLGQATDLIVTRTDTRPLCFNSMENPQASIFQRVVNQFFLAAIQKEVATLNRTTFSLLSTMDDLEQSLESATPPAYLVWQEQRTEVIEAGRQAMRDHVAAIEPLFIQCGFLPGPSSESPRNQ